MKALHRNGCKPQAPAALFPVKEVRYALNRRLYDPKDSLDNSDNRNPLTMPVIEPLFSGYLADSLVTLPDGLSWLPLHKMVLL